MTPLTHPRPLLCLAVLLLTPALSTADPLDDVARAMSDKLAALQSVRVKGQMTYEYESHGRAHKQDMKSELLFQRPGRLKVVTDHFRFIANGETIFLRLAYRRKYALAPQDTTLEGLVSDERFHEMESMTVDERALVSSDPYAVLSGYASRHKLERLADERQDGQMCWVIRQNLAGEEGAEFMPGISHVIAWIAQKTGLIVRLEAKPDSPLVTAKKDDEEEDEGEGEPQNMRMEYRMTEVDVNASLTPADFAFVPESGDKKAESVAALYGADHRTSGQGLQQFALSGKPAPDFELNLVDGGAFKMSAQKGKVVVVDFWATWCGPCVRAMPHMRELHEAFRDKGVVFIGVSHDQEGDEEKIKKSLAKHKIEYPTGIDPDEHSIGKAYAVRGIPCVVLVDTSGVVQGRLVGFSTKGNEMLKSALEKVLAGDSLPSAAPMPEASQAEDDDEEFAMNDRTELDDKFFVRKWKGPAVPRRRGMSADHNNFSVRISPRFFSVLSDRSLLVLDPVSGDTVRVMPLPDAALVKNEMQQAPAFQYLHAPDGGVAVAVQRLYEIEKKSGRHRSYHNRGSTVTGVSSTGVVLWTISLDKDVYVSEIHSMPVSADRDILLVECSSQFLLIDAAGGKIVDQRIVYGDRIEFDDRNHDGTIEVYVIGNEAAAYELRLPK